MIITPYIILLLNVVLKAWYLTANSIAGDEPFSIYHAQMDISTLIRQLSLGNNPPLYELLLHFWIQVAGISPLAVRIPSLIFSSLSALVIYKFAREFFSYKTGLTAGLLFTFSTYQLVFAHEARVYPLFELLTILSMYFFIRIVCYEKNKDFYWLTAINLLLVYAHYFGYVIVILQLMWSLNYRSLWRIPRGLIYLMLAFLILIIPNLIILSKQAYQTWSAGTWVPPCQNLGNLMTMIKVFTNSSIAYFLVFITLAFGFGIHYYFRKITRPLVRWAVIAGILPLLWLLSLSVFFPMPVMWHLTSMPVVTIFFVIVVIILASIYISVKQYHRKEIIDRVLISWFLFPLMIFYFFSLKWIPFHLPVFLDRYLIFITPVFAILMARMIILLLRKFKESSRYLIWLSVLLLAIITTHLNPDNHRKVETVVNSIGTLRQPRTPLIVSPAYFVLNFTYYYDRELFRKVDAKDIYKNLFLNLTKDDLYFVSDLKDLSFPGSKEIWYLDAGMDLPIEDQVIYKELRPNFHLMNVMHFDEKHHLYYFRR